VSQGAAGFFFFAALPRTVRREGHSKNPRKRDRGKGSQHVQKPSQAFWVGSIFIACSIKLVDSIAIALQRAK
jgi:hypothetical protein